VVGQLAALSRTYRNSIGKNLRTKEVVALPFDLLLIVKGKDLWWAIKRTVILWQITQLQALEYIRSTIFGYE